jgi:predicted DNA-binding protein YlxM (UPF0122 family)
MNKRDFLIQNAEELHRLYYDEGLTTRQIGKKFGMSKHPVEDAMRSLGFACREERTKGTKPTKEFLQKAVFEDHRSLKDVARELNCDYGSIKYWAHGYGIEIPKLSTWAQRNAQRGYERPDKETLESLYILEGCSAHVIAQELGVSKQAIKDALQEYGIPVRHSGWTKMVKCQHGHKVRSIYEQRIDDWLYAHNLDHTYEPITPFNKKSHADFLCKGEYIEIFGVTDSDWYDRRKAYKIEQYKSLGIPLIVINFWDFGKERNRLWERKLNHLLE